MEDNVPRIVPPRYPALDALKTAEGGQKVKKKAQNWVDHVHGMVHLNFLWKQGT